MGLPHISSSDNIVEGVQMGTGSFSKQKIVIVTLNRVRSRQYRSSISIASLSGLEFIELDTDTHTLDSGIFSGFYIVCCVCFLLKKCHRLPL